LAALGARPASPSPPLSPLLDVPLLLLSLSLPLLLPLLSLLRLRFRFFFLSLLRLPCKHRGQGGRGVKQM
jgi:hypothetical protein